MWDRARLDRSLEKYQEGSGGGSSEIKCIYVYYVGGNGRRVAGARGGRGRALRAGSGRRRNERAGNLTKEAPYYFRMGYKDAPRETSLSPLARLALYASTDYTGKN